MATAKRLSNEDVRAIFECFHENRYPPPHLHFQIVPVGSNGQRLSPPGYRFEDGLYVLLKHQKKNKKNRIFEDRPQVPPHLMSYLMTNFPPMTCKWGLSGPQFPKDKTAIQQRYCYSTGDDEYSAVRGATLWTMHLANGKECEDYRLLHVYYSAKRAANQGLSSSSPGKDTESIHASPPKKRARLTTPPPRPMIMTLNIEHGNSYSLPPASSPPPPALSLPSRSFSFDMSSPSFQSDSDPVSPISPSRHNDTNNNDNTSFVTPVSDIFDKMNNYIDGNNNSPPFLASPQQAPRHERRQYSAVSSPPNNTAFASSLESGFTAKQVTPPNSSQIMRRKTASLSSPPIPAARTTTTIASTPPLEQHPRSPETIIAEYHNQWEPHSFDMDADLIDFDPFWSDELVPPSDDESSSSTDTVTAFRNRLAVLHESFKEKIFCETDKAQQGILLQILSSWAKQMAQSPLGKVHIGQDDDDDDVSNKVRGNV